jgi:lipopolysaccharide export system permease protein
MTGTLARYFGMRFFNSLMGIIGGLLLLVVLIDYIEMMRRLGSVPNAAPLDIVKVSLFRVPQMVERLFPFCLLIAAMFSYLNLSRRLELVVSRAAGMSAWQFTAPAIIVAMLVGAFATAAYNPVAALLAERSKRLESELSGETKTSFQHTLGGGFWVSQASGPGYAIVNAASSRDQGLQLNAVTVFVFDQGGHFVERVEAKAASLQQGFWALDEARVYRPGILPRTQASYRLETSLTPTQVMETFSTPETVPFWQLPYFIDTAEKAGLTAAGYHLQFQKLLARPFLFASMVLLAAAFSLRFFRFGGVQKMVLAGVTTGFLLFVMSKVTDDLSKAEFLPPIVGAWLPVVLGSLIGVVALLHQEDG